MTIQELEGYYMAAKRRQEELLEHVIKLIQGYIKKMMKKKITILDEVDDKDNLRGQERVGGHG